MNVERDSNNQITGGNGNTDGEENDDENKVEFTSFASFLETSPPSRSVVISNITTKRYYSHAPAMKVISTPDIDLFCEHKKCNGNRVFRSPMASDGLSTSYKYLYLSYTCSNCRQTQKIYFLALKVDSKGSENGVAYKFGELPVFGPRTPSKLISLVRPDRDEFIKGRNCESQGLGIGAYAYYRRIVENQKNRILNRIIRVAKSISEDSKTIEALEAAKKEKRFSKAVELVKEAIPPALLINGQNPLILLHSALSVGLHTQSDESCLEAAQDIRIVLAELAERLSQALRDEAKLNEAVNRLASRQSAK